MVENIGDYGPNSPRLVDFLGLNDSVTGRSMRKMMRRLDANASQKYAEFLFIKQKNMLPKGWRGLYLLFTGTVWKRPDNKKRYIPYLLWNGAKWQFGFHMLDFVFNSRYRAIALDNGDNDF